MVDHRVYGRNPFVMAASTHTQYYFELWGVYIDDMDRIDDPSDLYLKCHRGDRKLVYIGSITFLLFMAKLLPMFMKGRLPWHEMVIQSNDYQGCNRAVRSVSHIFSISFGTMCSVFFSALVSILYFPSGLVFF